jgi:hypothetical protein
MMGDAGQVEALLADLRQAFEVLLGEFPRRLADLAPWQAALFIPLGLVSLFYGLKLFRGMVVAYAVIVGALAGQMVAARFAVHPAGGMIVGGLVFGALAWPLLKYAAVLLGGLAGALLAAVLVFSWSGDPVHIVGAAAVGFVVGLVLGALMFRAIIIFMTSVLGAHLVVVGVIVLVTAFGAVGDAVLAGLEAKRFFLPVLVGVPAVIGIVYQAHLAEEESKKQKNDDE